MSASWPRPAAQRVVVVGGSVAGLRAAEGLRRSGYAGEVLVVGAEPHLPYHRPPLSKEALASGPDAEALALPLGRHAQHLTWRLGQRVTSSDLDAHTVTVEDGSVIDWDGLVVATGLRPRRLELPGPATGRHELRTVEDAVQLRAALVPGTRLVVVGAGFIGCEVAATARGLGVGVDVVAPEPVPMQQPLQADLGRAVQAVHEREGVRFHLGTLPVGLGGEGRLTSVALDDGREIGADVLLAAVGATPDVGWLRGNGLDLTDGVLCDDHLRVQGRPDVVACGDVARFPNLLFDDVPRRVEHATMASDTGKQAGRVLASLLRTGEADGKAFAPVPSFWTDQFELRIQSFGAVGLGGEDVRVLEGDLTGEVTVGYHRDDELVGVVCVGMAGRQRHWHDTIAARRPSGAA